MQPKGSDEHACIFKLTCKLCACVRILNTVPLHLYDGREVKSSICCFPLVSLFTQENTFPDHIYENDKFQASACALLWPRSPYLIFGLFGFFFQLEQYFSLTIIQLEQCFSLTIIQPEQCFSTSFS